MKIDEYLNLFSHQYQELQQSLYKCQAAYETLEEHEPRIIKAIRLLRHYDAGGIVQATLKLDYHLYFEFERVSKMNRLVSSVGKELVETEVLFDALCEYFEEYERRHKTLLKNYTIESLMLVEQRGDVLLHNRFNFELSKVKAVNRALVGMQEVNSLYFLSNDIVILPQEEVFLSLDPEYRNRIVKEFQLIRLSQGTNIFERLYSLVLRKAEETPKVEDQPYRKTDYEQSGWVGDSYRIKRAYKGE